jgi:hypothetical protein
MRTEKEVIDWRVLPSFAYDALREELETAWLRGWNAGDAYGETEGLKEREQRAADYAERVVGGSTRPERSEVSDEF